MKRKEEERERREKAMQEREARRNRAKGVLNISAEQQAQLQNAAGGEQVMAAEPSSQDITQILLDKAAALRGQLQSDSDSDSDSGSDDSGDTFVTQEPPKDRRVMHRSASSVN